MGNNLRINRTKLRPHVSQSTKVGIICYHRNLSNYPKEWIQKFKESILGQSWKAFTIYEVNYGGTQERIFDNSIFESLEFPTFVHTMNYLLDKAFENHDFVFNTNIDDYYHKDRIAKQLMILRQGYDLVSSNFCLVKEDKIDYYHHFDTIKDIKGELEKRHNIIAHPVVAYSKRFWTNNKYYIPEEIPAEDYYLWKRAADKGVDFYILKDNLLFQRIHTNSVCQSQNR